MDLIESQGEGTQQDAVSAQLEPVCNLPFNHRDNIIASPPATTVDHSSLIETKESKVVEAQTSEKLAFAVTACGRNTTTSKGCFSSKSTPSLNESEEKVHNLVSSKVNSASTLTVGVVEAHAENKLPEKPISNERRLEDNKGSPSSHTVSEEFRIAPSPGSMGSLDSCQEPENMHPKSYIVAQGPDEIEQKDRNTTPLHSEIGYKATIPCEAENAREHVACSERRDELEVEQEDLLEIALEIPQDDRWVTHVWLVCLK